MIRLLLLFITLYLAQIVQGASTDATSSSCPPPDASSRSIWSILYSCALTLLICIWQAIHPDVPPYEQGRNSLLAWCKRLAIGMICFIAPEVVVCIAAGEWQDVRHTVQLFREKGYEWSMTHGYFAQMGGFFYCDDKGSLRRIDSHEFLERCEANEIANPFVTVREIKDKSKADAVGKVILGFQLLWFALQVSLRHFSGLTVTLVELDTVCMAVLSLFLLFFWRHKPLCPEYPHIFYSHQRLQTDSAQFLQAWKSKPCYLNEFRTDMEEPHPSLVGGVLQRVHGLVKKLKSLKPGGSSGNRKLVFDALFATWIIFGGLHLAAWNYPFVTEAEKIIWRVASLLLTGIPPVMMSLCFLSTWMDDTGTIFYDCSMTVIIACNWLGSCLGLCSRFVLVGLMFASLRALPCSAYQVISWTAYIPHF